MRAGGDGRAHGLLGRSSSWLSRLAARSSPRSSRTRGREASSHALGTRGAETGSQNIKKRLPCAILKKGKVNLFEQSRNPIIYGGAVERIDVEDAAGGSDALAPGKPVYFSDWKSRIIGWGFYNPTSTYRCRVMELASDSPDGSFASGDGDPLSSDRVASFLRRRILQAREARKAIGLPSAHKTNAYRLINSEGDSLSGLVVDRFGTDLVVQSSSAWVESHKDVVLAALAESAGDDPEEEDAAAETIAWRSDAGILKKEGVEVESGFELYKIERNGDGAAPTVAPAPEAGGPESMESLVLENGARFAVRLDMQVRFEEWVRTSRYPPIVSRRAALTPLPPPHPHNRRKRAFTATKGPTGPMSGPCPEESGALTFAVTRAALRSPLLSAAPPA